MCGVEVLKANAYQRVWRKVEGGWGFVDAGRSERLGLGSQLKTYGKLDGQVDQSKADKSVRM